MVDSNGNGLKNVVIAALVSAIMAFFSGYAASSMKDSAVLNDHEARIRLMENAITRLTAIQESLNARRQQ